MWEQESSPWWRYWWCTKVKTYKIKLQVDSHFGTPRAFVIQSKQNRKFYLLSAAIETCTKRIIHFDCDSWIYPIKKTKFDRLFFSNRVSSIIYNNVHAWYVDWFFVVKLHYTKLQMEFIIFWQCYLPSQTPTALVEIVGPTHHVGCPAKNKRKPKWNCLLQLSKACSTLPLLPVQLAWCNMLASRHASFGGNLL